ncbi:hypothetical protein GC194_05340 [bacterium]|nr:hypothetical protein [bacterium]
MYKSKWYIYICAALSVFLWSCAKDLSEGLTYRIENNRVIFEFSAEQMRELSRGNGGDLEDFKDLIRRKLEKVDSLGNISMDGWEFMQIDSNTYQFVKDLSALDGKLQYGQKMMLESFMEIPDYFNPTESANFGYLPGKVPNIHETDEGNYQFFLPSFTQAQKVFLSGTFNNWNTISLPMHKTDSGWLARLHLPPGKYEYKYVVDGNWTEDPYNPYTNRNEHGTLNSQLVIPNYVFKLRGFERANEVVLSGEFVGWDEHKIMMQKKHGVWYAPVYLRDGSYAYKFIVDRQWMVDPDNERRITIDGHENSLLLLGQQFHFELNGFQNARQVYCTGSFINWNETALPMNKTAAGWECNYTIPKGNYEYRYIVDGQWTNDPKVAYTVPNQHGTRNMWLVVGEPYLFELDGFEYARRVVLSGTFNNWNEGLCEMQRVDGKWQFPVYLKPGKQLYKFIVDGLWMTDPNNNNLEPNVEGTYNSVLWVD